MTTYTSTGCYSACTEVFLAGEARVVHRDARLGFHRPGLPGVWASLFDGEVEADAHAMLAADVDPAFVARAKATPNADLWTPTNDELLKAHFATRLSDGAEFSIVVDDPRTAHDEIEGELLKNRLYRVLKLYEPPAYRDVVGVIDKTIAEQGTLGDIRQEVLAKVSDVLGRRLPFASDAALLEFAKHFVATITVLERIDTNVCYTYLFPASGQSSAMLYLPKTLRDEDDDVVASVIESAATAPKRSPSEVEMTAAFRQLGARLGGRLGAARAVAVFQTAEEPLKNPQGVCAAMREIYEEILTMPTPDAGLALRSLAVSS